MEKCRQTLKGCAGLSSLSPGMDLDSPRRLVRHIPGYICEGISREDSVRQRRPTVHEGDTIPQGGA